MTRWDTQNPASAIPYEIACTLGHPSRLGDDVSTQLHVYQRVIQAYTKIHPRITSWYLAESTEQSVSFFGTDELNLISFSIVYKHLASTDKTNDNDIFP